MDPSHDTFIQTRASLLIRLRDCEDQDSWCDFYETYKRLIYRVALKAGLSESEAQDVLQETMLVVARNIKDFKYDREVGSFKGWLLNTTYWRIGDIKRKRRPHDEKHRSAADETQGAKLIENIPDPAANPLDAIWEEEWSSNLLEAAKQNIKQRVKPKHYQAFDYFVLKKMSVKDVTRKLGLTPGQVYCAGYRISGLMKNEVRRLEKKLV